MLRGLAKASARLAPRASQRFARSSAKRDPKFMFNLDGDSLTNNQLHIIENDINTIASSKFFNPQFCLGQGTKVASRNRYAQLYVAKHRSKIDLRKPEPGFNPLIFAEKFPHCLKLGIDPYAEFLRLGRRPGPWLTPLIEGGPGKVVFDDQFNVRVALHVHAFYIDQLRDILDCLEVNQILPDLFVSICNNNHEKLVRDILSNYGGIIKKISVFPNVGRDIGPMLSGFAQDLLENYDVIGHVHTKKSPHVKNANWVKNWFNFCIYNTLGSQKSGPMLDRIVQEMSEDPSIGIVYPEDPHLPGWGVSLTAASQMSQRLGVKKLPRAFNFPVGTMFWMRAEAFKPFASLKISWSDYPTEPLPSDGTMLHALERMFGVLPSEAGWNTRVIHTKTIVR